MSPFPNVDIYRNVLDPALCERVLDSSRELLTKGGQISATNLAWHPAIVRASGLILVRDCDAEIAETILSQLRNKGIATSSQYFVKSYIGTKLSYVPWHDDNSYQSAITIYLNLQWNPDWGGIFLYADRASGAIYGHMPQFNTAVRNMSKVLHCTTPVALDAQEPRFSIQLFERRT